MGKYRAKLYTNMELTNIQSSGPFATSMLNHSWRWGFGVFAILVRCLERSIRVCINGG
jgi:hypothetical protein